jgi:hypothetical protein
MLASETALSAIRSAMARTSAPRWGAASLAQARCAPRAASSAASTSAEAALGIDAMTDAVAGSKTSKELPDPSDHSPPTYIEFRATAVMSDPPRYGA